MPSNLDTVKIGVSTAFVGSKGVFRGVHTNRRKAMKKTALTYHHGDLRNALLNAALDILAREGYRALTLRRVAADAGVSHAAPAHYFPSLETLLTALAAIGFERLEAALRRVRKRHQANAAVYVDRLLEAYLDFAKAETGVFELMFASHRVNWTDETLKASSKRAYGELEHVAGTIARAQGEAYHANTVALEQLIWSAAHGYAMLALGHQVPKPGQPGPAGPPQLSAYLGLRPRPQTVR